MVVLSPPGITRPSMLFEVFGGAHEDGFRARAFERLRVRFEIALQRENPDALLRQLLTSPASASALLRAASRYRDRASPSRDLRWLRAAFPDRCSTWSP